MTSRPASSIPLNRWPFFAASAVLMAIAFIAIVSGEMPPPLGAVMIALVCAGGGIVVTLAPFLMEYEARLRLAEAAVQEAAEAQARRLTQTGDQLAQAVSRSQSTEEQAGQALGTLEELAERMTAQAEELVQALMRSGEREHADRKAEIDRLARERDEKLPALEARLGSIVDQLSEVQTTVRDARSASERTIEALAAQVVNLAKKLDSLSTPQRDDAKIASDAPVTERPQDPPAPPAIEKVVVVEEAKTAQPRAPAATELENGADHSGSNEGVSVPPVPPSRSPGRVRQKHASIPARIQSVGTVHAVSADTAANAPAVATLEKTAILELPFEGLPESRPALRTAKRDAAGATSLIATAYIGIGNKLFVRGEGPGLSWEQGVPMQFIAIGKWGWTSTPAHAPVTCRIYRNDDTPMLDENIVISPGAKAEITPRF